MADAHAAAVELLWGPRPEARRGPKPTLSPPLIAAAGIELADREGLAAVTMQRVAETLAVTKMALYRYVPGKDELVALMTDVAMGQPPDLSDLSGWRPKLVAWSAAVFERFRRHPWSVETTVGSRVVGPNELDWSEQVAAALSGVCLNGGEILDVALTLAGHARTLAQQTRGVTDGRGPEASMGAGMAALLRGREDRYPALTAAIASAASAGAQDNALDFGRDRILDGVAALIAARSGRPS